MTTSIIVTELERAGQGPVDSGMRRQSRAQTPEAVPKRGLEMAGHGNHPWRRPRCGQAFDQCELGFRPERRL
jgi:hypothetical protein